LIGLEPWGEKISVVLLGDIVVVVVDWVAGKRLKLNVCCFWDKIYNTGEESE